MTGPARGLPVGPRGEIRMKKIILIKTGRKLIPWMALGGPTGSMNRSRP